MRTTFRNGMVPTVMLATVLALAACGLDASRTAPGRAVAALCDKAAQERLIVPGERIGVFRLGMDRAQLLHAAGVPASTTQFNDRTKYSYGLLSVVVSEPEGLVKSVTLESVPSTPDLSYLKTQLTRYTTRDGLSLGSHDLSVKASLGSPREFKIDETKLLHGHSTGYLSYSGITFHEVGGMIYRIVVVPVDVQ